LLGIDADQRVARIDFAHFDADAGLWNSACLSALRTSLGKATACALAIKKMQSKGG